MGTMSSKAPYYYRYSLHGFFLAASPKSKVNDISHTLENQVQVSLLLLTLIFIQTHEARPS